MKKPRINKRFITEEVDGEIVFFDTEKSVLVTLNETAAAMFREIKKGRTKEEIARKIVKIYDTTEKQALKDCSVLEKSLKKRQILV